MRTTLDIDDGLLRKAKKRAAEDGITLSQLVEDALRLRLMPPSTTRRPFRLKLLTRKGKLRPGVDLADRESLHDAMESRPES